MLLNLVATVCRLLFIGFGFGCLCFECEFMSFVGCIVGVWDICIVAIGLVWLPHDLLGGWY